MNRYNITEDDFFLQKDTYRFIKDYVDTYHECPSYTAVVAECKEFDYDPEVSDNIEYLCRKVKSDRAKRESLNCYRMKQLRNSLSYRGINLYNG